MKIPEQIIEHAPSGLEGEYSPEYMVEPERIKERAEGVSVLCVRPAESGHDN